MRFKLKFLCFKNWLISTTLQFLSLSSSSGNPIMQMLIYLILSHRSLKLSPLFKIIFTFCCCLGSSAALSSGSLILSSALSSLLLNPCTFHSSYCIFKLCDFCVVISYLVYLFVNVLSVFILLPSSMSIWWLHWTLYQMGYLSLFSFFYGVLSCYFNCNIFLFFPVFLIAWPCVCFYVLGETALSPSLEEVALYGWWTLLFNHALVLGFLLNCLLNCKGHHQ